MKSRSLDEKETRNGLIMSETMEWDERRMRSVMVGSDFDGGDRLDGVDSDMNEVCDGVDRLDGVEQ
jgi:hypothetical protein